MAKGAEYSACGPRFCAEVELCAQSVTIPPLFQHPLGSLGALMSSQPMYKVIFHNGGQVYEVFARQIYQSDMWGFVEIEELVFGERSQILVDPGEEKLKNEFSGVKRSYIPLQSIVRIDEVAKEGAARISEGGGAKIAPFPVAPQPVVPSQGDE
jgi:hypothetical protein